MRLAEPRRTAEEQHIGLLLDEAEVEEVLDLRPVDLLRPGPLELIEGFDEREASEADASLEALVVAVGNLAFDETLEILDVAPALLGCGEGELMVMGADVRELQAHQELRERLHGLLVALRGVGIIGHRLWPRRR